MADLVRTSPLARYWEAGQPATLEATGVTIAEKPFLPKWLLRGTPETWRGRVQAHLGLALPGPNVVTTALHLQCLWLRPDEWLLVGDSPDVDALLRGLGTQNDPTGTSVEVTDRFQCLEVRGSVASDLLNCGCSVNLSAEAFPPGRCCQTRIEEVPVVISRPHAALAFDVMPERALTDYLWRWAVAVARDFR